MTWNIGYARWKNSAAQDNDMPQVAAVIAEFKPDLVVLQEQATSGQLAVLLNALNGRYRGKTSASAKGSRGISILSRLPVERWETFQAAPGWGGLLAAVRSEKLQQPFCVLGCYAPAGRNSKLRAQCCRGFVDRARRQNLPVFMAGDFNMDPQDILDRVTPFFTDNRRTDLETYRCLVDVARDCAAAAGNTCLGGRRIDYIFALPKEIPIEKTKVLRGQRLFGMDHSPVLVSVREEALELDRSPEKLKPEDTGHN